MLASRLNMPVTQIENIAVWGNASYTVYPDCRFAKSGGRSVMSMVDFTWIKSEYIPAIRSRGPEIVKWRKFSSAGSTATAAIDHVRDWTYGNPKWHCMVCKTDGKLYGIESDLYYSFPFTTEDSETHVLNGISLEDQDT